MALEGLRFIGLAPGEGLQPLLAKLSAACAPWSDRAMYEEISASLQALRQHMDDQP